MIVGNINTIKTHVTICSLFTLCMAIQTGWLWCWVIAWNTFRAQDPVEEIKRRVNISALSINYQNDNTKTVKVITLAKTIYPNLDLQ